MTAEMVGAVGGILGTVAGIAGLIMGWISLKRTDDYKALDLRVQLRREETTVLSGIEALSDFLPVLNKSRLAVLSAKGMLNSGVRAKWENDFVLASTTIADLGDSAAEMGGDVSQLTTDQLEARLARAHDLALRVKRVRDEFDTAWAADEKDRDIIRSQPPRGR